MINCKNMGYSLREKINIISRFQITSNVCVHVYKYGYQNGFEERTFIPYIIVKSKSQIITTLNAVQSNMSCLLIIIT